MKILVIAKWLVKWNGTSRVVYELSKYFQKNHEVRLVIYKDFVDSDWEKDLFVYKIHSKGLFATGEINDIIKEFQPDIIHSHDWLGILTLPSHVPLISTVHSNWPMNWFYNYKSFFAGIFQEIPNEIKLHLSNEVVCVSEFQQAKLAGRGVKSQVIYNGISTFNTTSLEAVCLKHPCILLVGAIDKRKYSKLITVLEYLPEEIYVYICGTILDKSIYQKLKAFKNVTVLGYVESAYGYYESADIYVSTSDMEVFGLTLVEAQSAGCPVIAFNLGPFSEIVIDNYTGFLVQQDNCREMAERISYLLKNEEIRKEMSKNAEMVSKSKFSWPDKAEMYLDTFHKLTQ